VVVHGGGCTIAHDNEHINGRRKIAQAFVAFVKP
jgi:hypothetical protein